MAASEAAKEAVYLGSFLGELDGHDDSPIDLRLDNKAAGDLAYNPEPRTAAPTSPSPSACSVAPWPSLG